MNNVRVILRKELLTYFNSPIAYVFLMAFLLISGWLFTSGLFLRGEASVAPFIELAPLLFLFFIPSMTMRLFSEELSRGTFEVLATLPVRDGEIIFGKFLAAALLLLTALASTWVFPAGISVAGDPDGGQILASYTGLYLLGLAFLSMGAFASSLTHREILAFILGFMIMMVFFIVGKVVQFVPPELGRVVDFVGVDSHMSNISRGVIDSRDVVYFISLSLFFLYLTQYVLSSRRWR